MKKIKTVVVASFAAVVQKHLYDYDTTLRSCYAVQDDFGNLIPCNGSTWHSLQ